MILEGNGVLFCAISDGLCFMKCTTISSYDRFTLNPTGSVLNITYEQFSNSYTLMYDKYVDFEISAHESFLNNHPHVRSNKILKLINIIVSGSKLTKDPKIIIFLIDN